MDEFDVFMDQLNRGISLQQLQRYAEMEEHKSQQFIFITPHEVNLPPSDFVKLHALAPPEREPVAPHT